MFKRFEKDIRFIVYTGVFALLFMAGMFVLRDYLETVGPEADIIKQATNEIVILPSSKVEPMLTSADKKPVMLIIYASWCGPCRREMPGLLELIDNHELDAFHPIFLSLDYQQRNLGRFLVRKNYRGLFTPYLVANEAERPLPRVLGERGSHFDGGIPYIGFFDAKGQLMTEFIGGMRQDDLRKAAQMLALHKETINPSVND